MKKIVFLISGVAMLTSCVSKKKYVELEQKHGEVQSKLMKTAVEKEELEARFAEIQQRVDDYNRKINSLSEEGDKKLMTVGNTAVISNDVKKQMINTLAKVDQNELRNAKSLKDSMNLAVSYNLQRSLNTNISEDEDIAINIDETVVMISISDKLLFNTGSFRVSNKADLVLAKIAEIINSEPSLEVMVEGHTDPRTISTDCIQDNWDLSVKRATSIVRKLQNQFNVDPQKLIASGRSSFDPVADNDTKEGMAANRRTRIVILPNIDKFFALMASN